MNENKAHWELFGIFMVGLCLCKGCCDECADGWRLTGSLNDARDAHTAALLLDGTVLVTGGYDAVVLAGVERYDPRWGIWCTTGSLIEARSHHTTTLLPDGTVLAVGGNRDDTQVDTAERYNPASETWEPAGTLETARQDHTATLLPDGTVLVAGGVAGPSDAAIPLMSAEVYDPVSGTWTPTGPLNEARFCFTATLLPNGTVLAAGGEGVDGAVVSAELYDPASGTWTPTGLLSDGRHDHTATLLDDGTVLVAGGVTGVPGESVYLTSAEVYDPALGTWTPTGSMQVERGLHCAGLLPSGNVLVAGGEQSTGWIADAEVYDPVLETWTPIDSLSAARCRFTLTGLDDGRLLATGGFNGGGVLTSSEFYCEGDPKM